MSRHALQAVSLFAALALVATAAPAQQPAPRHDSAQASASMPPDTSAEKLKLLEATRVSTENAARRAAEERAKETGRKESAKKDKSKKKEASPEVSEFRPAVKAENKGQDAVKLPAKNSGKSPLKDIRGSMYGSTGGGLRETGGEVGASSKGGKTHIYVGSAQSRSDAATPH